MSGTDPRGKWFRKGDPTQAFQPEGSGPVEQPAGLPKIPGITLAYEIARGGMGVVYAGRQDFLDRRVAVKFLSVELGGQSFVQRFQREAKILAGIKHPNIVACHMADTTDDGQSYLVMEFIDGPSLKAWIQDNGPVSPMASLRLVRASAQALAHAHQSEIIHRDVKPENILLETLTSTSLDVAFPFTPKLVDLGLARMTHESAGMGLTSPGSVMGTPSTMSPEQFDDPDSVDFRSDIYGLGCCLYEMLVGAPAFRGTKLTDIVTKKREAVGPNPCDENPAVPTAVGALCQRMLASDREDRPSSYKELDQLLEELMRALVTARRTDTIVEMPAGDGGATIVSPARPGGFAPAEPTRRATQPPKDRTAPGMLNTGELDFLSEGGSAAAAEPPPPAFRDGPSDTQPTMPAGAGADKRGLYLGIGALALVAACVGVWLGMRGGAPDPAPNPTNVVGSGEAGAGGERGAALPVAVRGPARVDVGETFAVVANVTAPAGAALDYTWTAQRGLLPIGDPKSAQARFLLQDGLPGMEFSVSVSVSQRQGEAAPARATHTFVVGECPVDLPLMAPSSQLGQNMDGLGLRWVRVTEDRFDPRVVGKVMGGKPAATAGAVGDDAYWEYAGTATPTDMGKGRSRSLIAVTFGDAGYGVRSTLVGASDMSIEIVERVPGQDEWRPLATPVAHAWKLPAGTDNDNRTWFSIRREDRNLVIEVGEAIQEPIPKDGDPPPQVVSREAKRVFELSQAEAEQLSQDGKVAVSVAEGRAILRVERR